MKPITTILLSILLTTAATAQDLSTGQDAQVGHGLSKNLETAANASSFLMYQERLRERRAVALSIRRQMNAGKVHKYWTAVYVDYNPLREMQKYDPVSQSQERLRRHDERMARARYWRSWRGAYDRAISAIESAVSSASAPY